MKAFLSLLFLSGLAGTVFAQENLKREALPQDVNSGGMNLRPLISGDGQTLYFSRIQHPGNLGGKRDLQDIYVSTRLGENSWAEAQNLGQPVNNRNVNSAVATNAAGTELLLISSYKKIKAPLAIARKVGEQWTEPEAVLVKDYYNSSEYMDFYWSPVADVLFLAIQREDSRGDQDLYVCLREEDGNWGAPQNLGVSINTASADFAPFLAADGRTLLFASYGHRGLGGSDLYFSTRLDESWTNWSAPVNFGKGVNSQGEETYASMPDRMDELFFSSYRAGAEKRDLYRSVLPERFLKNAQDRTLLAESLSEPEDIIEANLSRMMAEENEATASVEYEEEASNATLIASNSPDIAAEVSPGSEPVKDKPEEPELPFNTTTTKQAATESAALAYHEYIDAEGRQRVDVLRNIYFDFNSAKLRLEYTDFLDELVAWMKTQPKAKLLLVGHADEVGTAKQNQAFGLLRAKAVAAYLDKAGVPRESIHLETDGEAKPLASNDDDLEGRELNRRVDIQFILTF
jgi:OOP family OmpA-OmpF porin